MYLGNFLVFRSLSRQADRLGVYLLQTSLDKRKSISFRSKNGNSVDLKCLITADEFIGYKVRGMCTIMEKLSRCC